ncbi:hypothetical protein ABZS29_19935 [Kribbella sp. NPDC005582]|uniref:hypothetical protein n=1 Tax=Kribbella sp. NPDC005582 TaxID=3156893 RepID=UPI0033AC12E2
MQDYLLRAPTWVIGVITGGLFAISMLVVSWFQGISMAVAAIVAVAGGLIFGLTLALATRAPRREQLRALERLPVADWKRVRSAVWRGPVPVEERIRDAALDLATRMFTRTHRFRKPLYFLAGLNLVLAIVQLVSTGRLWYIVSAVFWTFLPVAHWYNLRRLERRIELLQAGTST